MISLIRTCAHAQAAEELGELDGVLSFSELAQPLVARLAERLGLPGESAQLLQT